MAKIKKIFILLLITFSFLVIINANEVYASSASITASQTVTQGSSVTITASVTAGAWNLTLSGAGTSKQMVDSTTVDGNASASTSITFTASNIGTYDFTLTGDMTDYDTEATETVSKSCTVTVVAAETTSDSSDSSSSSDSGSSTSDSATTTTTVSAPVLSNLGITPYDFSGFKSGTTSYSVTVPNSCTSVTIYATTSSTGATISGTGTVTLKEGTNKYTVTVSNSAGSKSYTLSIIRQSEESEIVANSSDEENEDTSTGIGLDSLTITGYQLNEEFNINTYEYTVTISEDITEILLEEIKGKIFWTANSEDVNVEYEIEVIDDVTGTITLVVKDEEKEYSRYVITFTNSGETEEEESEKVAVVGKTSSNDSGNGGTTDTDNTTKKIIVLIGCIVISVCFGVYFAINSYMKSRRLEVYEPKSKEDENEELENEQENIVESIMKNRQESKDKIPVMNVSATDSSNEVNNEDLDLGKTNSIDLAKDSQEKLADLGGYRKMRKGFSSGKH